MLHNSYSEAHTRATAKHITNLYSNAKEFMVSELDKVSLLKAKCPKMGPYLTLNPFFTTGLFLYLLKV